MGGCASRPKVDLDGKAPEDLPAETAAAPSDAAAVAATTADVTTESKEDAEKESKEGAEVSETVEQENNKEEAAATEAAVVEDTPNAEGGNDATGKDGVKEETKPDEKPSQS